MAKKKGNKMNKTAKPVEDAKIGELIEDCPESAGIMMKHGMHCVGCHVSFDETLKEGALAHGMNKTEFKKMTAEIKKAMKKS
jgi:hybrid cluster-associated redox disulfide protein